MLYKTTLRLLMLCFAAFALATTAWAQDPEEELPDTQGLEKTLATPMELIVEKTLYHGDSIPMLTTQTVLITRPFVPKNDKERDQYNRLVRNVKLLLPIAKKARQLVLETYEVVRFMNEKEAEKHIKLVYQDLKREYDPIFRKLSRSQGRLLVKLIDRECNMSGYNIAKAFIGAAKANFFQGLGFLFGINLNKKYDPEGDDRMTERVVRLVENHQI